MEGYISITKKVLPDFARVILKGLGRNIGRGNQEEKEIKSERGTIRLQENRIVEKLESGDIVATLSFEKGSFMNLLIELHNLAFYMALPRQHEVVIFDEFRKVFKQTTGNSFQLDFEAALTSMSKKEDLKTVLQMKFLHVNKNLIEGIVIIQSLLMPSS